MIIISKKELPQGEKASREANLADFLLAFSSGGSSRLQKLSLSLVFFEKEVKTGGESNSTTSPPVFTS